MLAQGEKDGGALLVFDTGGTPQGAALAARAARKAKAAVILGPVFALEVPAVLAAVGTALPVLTFSNDEALVESGAFLFGITARQTVTAVLAYAARRGVRRVAVGGAEQGWGGQARAAALGMAGELGLEVQQLSAGEPGSFAFPPGTSADLLPDALLMPDAASLARLAPGLVAQGVQPLGAFQGLDVGTDQLRSLEGAWLAAPDPARYAGFARTFEERNGSRPGAITCLAYDAANIVNQMRLGGGIDRSALLVGTGFKAICGDVRFREDGSATRALAILAVSNGGLRSATGPGGA